MFAVARLRGKVVLFSSVLKQDCRLLLVKLRFLRATIKMRFTSALLRSSEATQFGFDDILGKTRGILRERRSWCISQQINLCVFRTKYGFWMENVVSGRHFKMVSPLPFFLESWKIKKLSYLVKVEGKGFSKSSTRSKSLHGARSSSPNQILFFFQKKHLLTVTGNPALNS